MESIGKGMVTGWVGNGTVQNSPIPLWSGAGPG